MTALLTLLLSLATAPAADLEDADAIRRRAQAAVAAARIETSLPLPTDAPPGQAPARRATPDLEGADLPVVGSGAFRVLGVVLGFVLLGVVTIVLAFAVARVLADLSWGERRVDGGADGRAGGRGPGRAGTSVSTGASGDGDEFLLLADRHGAEGRYEDATHCLLLGAIEHLTRGGAQSWSDAMTSRELLGGLDLDDERRRAFRALVHTVERSLFGGRRVDREAFERCRGELRTLVAGAPA